MQPKHPRLTLAVIALSYLMLAVDGSIAIASLPLIKADLGLSTTNLSWIQNSYTLVFGGLLLLGARMGDIFGRRKMFSFGLGFFVLASVLVGVAPTAGLSIIARALQGLGAAVLAPSSLTLLNTSFPTQPARGKALAVYGSITGIGPTLGLVLGGWIASAFDWRWAFLINAPIGIVLIIAAKKHLPETQPQQLKVDHFGAIFSVLGMGSIVYGLIRSADFGWGDLLVWGCLALGAGLIVAFVQIEKTVPQPLVPLRLFMSGQRSGANLARALFVGSMAAFWFFISQFLQIVKGLNALQTGMAFLPMTLASFAIAFFVPRLSKRFGETPFLAGGLITVSIGTLWLSQLSQHGSYFWQIALPMILVGIGQGASTIRLTSAGIAGVSAADSGAASGIVSTAVQLGNAFGLSALIAISATAANSAASAKQAITHQAQTALLGGGVMCLLALASVLIFVLPKRHQLDE